MATEKIEKHVNSMGNAYIDYEFPKSASEISGTNNTYTVPYDGHAVIYYTYANSAYSQFNLIVNSIALTPQTISSGAGNWNGLVGTVSFPVKKGDTIKITFYSTFAMGRIALRLFY